MLNHQGLALHEHEISKIVYRFAGSPSDVLGLSYTHQAAAGLIQVDSTSFFVGRNDRYEINSRDRNGRTPLHWAALRGNAIALKALVHARADIGTRDDKQRTALHLAVISGNRRCIELLLIAGSSIHARDKYGYQALHILVGYPYKTGIMDTLLLAGADVHSPGGYGASAIITACGSDFTGSYVLELLSAGAHVNDKDQYRDSALSYAIHVGNTRAVELLLRHNVDLKDTNNHGQAILHVLSLHGNLQIIALFMSSRLGELDAEERNKAGKTPWEAFQERPAPPEGFSEAFEALLAECRAQKNTSVAADLVEIEA